jgi:hypothetical protein
VHSERVQEELQEARDKLQEFKETYRRETGKTDCQLFTLPITEKPSTHDTYHLGYRYDNQSFGSASIRITIQV